MFSFTQSDNLVALEMLRFIDSRLADTEHPPGPNEMQSFKNWLNIIVPKTDDEAAWFDQVFQRFHACAPAATLLPDQRHATRAALPKPTPQPPPAPTTLAVRTIGRHHAHTPTEPPLGVPGWQPRMVGN